MSVCDVCGKDFDSGRYQVQVWPLPGSFDRFECAEKSYRRFLARQYLTATYGEAQAELLERAAAAPAADAPSRD